MSDLRQFFDVLFNDNDAVAVRVLHETEKRAFLNRVFHSPDEAAEYLEKHKAAFAAKGAFPCVGVNPRDDEHDVGTLKNIVVDIDGAPLPEWAAERADMVCSRDETHHHLFFVFAPMGASEANRAQYTATVKALLKLTGSKEKAAHDPERVIRLPGFAHGKSGKPAPGYAVKFVRDKIAHAAFNKRFAWLKADKTEQALDAAPVVKPDEKTSVNSIAYLKSLYLKKPELGAGDGRSRELFFIGLDAHAWGIPQADAVTLASEVSAARFNPPEDAATVAHQIASAYKYRKGEFGSLLTAAKGQTERQQLRARLQFETIQRARDLLAGFVYVHGAERLIETTSRFELTQVNQINNYLESKLGERVTLGELLRASAVEVADVLDYAPGQPMLFDRDGVRVFNRYLQGVPPERDKAHKKTAVKLFREHIAYLSTSEEEEKTLLNFFAFVAQNPGRKLSWAPLIISRHTGIGKSALAELAKNILGKNNVGNAESDDLTGQHTDYIAEKVLVISHEVETGDKNVMRRLKSLITETVVRVIAKYARTYVTENCANFLFFSNRIDAIRVDDNDRRLFVIYNKKEPRAQAYYDELFPAFTHGAGWIFDYLCGVDLSGFNPHARPAQTEGREILTKHSESELVTYLAEELTGGEGPFGKPFFSTRDVLNHVAFSAPESARRYASQRKVAEWLDYRGYSNYDYYGTDDKGSRKHYSVWFKGTREAFDEARKAVKTGDAPSAFG